MRFCYQCKHHSYYRKDYCTKPFCPRKGVYKNEKKFKKQPAVPPYQPNTSSWNSYNGGGGGGSGSGSGGGSSSPSPSFGGCGSWPSANNSDLFNDATVAEAVAEAVVEEAEDVDPERSGEEGGEEEGSAAKKDEEWTVEDLMRQVKRVFTADAGGNTIDGQQPGEPDGSDSAGSACNSKRLKRDRPDADALAVTPGVGVTTHDCSMGQY